MISLFYLITGGAFSVFLIVLAIYSIGEKKTRAAIISLISSTVLCFIWYSGYTLLSFPDYLLAIPLTFALLLVVLFFVPFGDVHPLSIGEVKKRVDERDVIFSREEYLPGTEQYEHYYRLRPEFREIDNHIRDLPELLEPGGRYYDPVKSTSIDHIFDVIENLTSQVDGPASSKRINVSQTEITSEIKKLVLLLGADDVGIAKLNPMWVYSHVGRGPEQWGTPIENNHKYAIVFCIEMNYSRVEKAPKLPVTEESAACYLRGSHISVSLAQYIRSLGYPARAHVSGSNYQIMLPPVAYDAGLGELGRIGYLISPKFGARIRLGAITTDLPLIPDKPIAFGVQDFCAKCRKCAINCPSGAIPKGAPESVRGVEKWPLNVEKCLQFWRQTGSDCGLCMRVCPYSHPSTFVHNIVRAGLKRSPIAHTLSVWGDDFLYGRKIKYDRGSSKKNNSVIKRHRDHESSS
ncbi:MAG: reductive dehalogenase [Candidatus Zixiibacteriota bacterium]|nr:MAG: reductive dehalogenase [candidate division Zixibacteria bacterium]